MKQFKNRKSLLKATFAISGLFLAGCVGSSSGDVACDYCDDVIIVDEMEQSDSTLVEGESYPLGDVVYTSKKQTAFASSQPAEPDFVPVKPKSACKTCPNKAERKAAAKQKPKVAPVEAPVVLPQVYTEDVVIEETKDISAVVEQAHLDAQGQSQAQLEAERLEAQRQEAERLEAERKAAEQAEMERLRAETERLRLEAERLQLEKEALEQAKLEETAKEETIIVSDAQTTVKDESCEEVKDWVASEGSTLRTLLLEWGDKVGWRVVWDMDRDYTLEASAVFRGRFVDVAAALLRSFARATPAPKGVFYKGNKVLVVSTREDENAD